MTTAAASTAPILDAAIIPDAGIGTSEIPDTRLYRLAKSFAAVHFEPDGKGRIVFLPEGAEVRVIGPSCLCDFFEVRFESQRYNMFKVDLLGPRSTPIERIPVEPTTVEPAPLKPNRIRPVRSFAMGACA